MPGSARPAGRDGAGTSRRGGALAEHDAGAGFRRRGEGPPAPRSGCCDLGGASRRAAPVRLRHSRRAGCRPRCRRRAARRLASEPRYSAAHLAPSRRCPYGGARCRRSRARPSVLAGRRGDSRDHSRAAARAAASGRVVAARPGGLLLEPTGDGGHSELLVREQNSMGAGPGDLVVAERVAGVALGRGRAKVIGGWASPTSRARSPCSPRRASACRSRSRRRPRQRLPRRSRSRWASGSTCVRCLS